MVMTKQFWPYGNMTPRGLRVCVRVRMAGARFNLRCGDDEKALTDGPKLLLLEGQNGRAGGQAASWFRSLPCARPNALLLLLRRQ